MPDFRGCAYGPWALRDLLRRRRDADERLIAWGVASVKPASGAEELLGALAPGPLAAIADVASTSGGSRQVVVLTDKRLLLLRANELGPAPEGLGVVVDASLATLRVASAPTHFEILGPETARRLKLSIKEPHSRDGARLVEALATLSEQDR
jgi:hypothetical protein